MLTGHLGTNFPSAVFDPSLFLAVDDYEKLGNVIAECFARH